MTEWIIIFDRTDTRYPQRGRGTVWADSEYDAIEKWNAKHPGTVAVCAVHPLS